MKNHTTKRDEDRRRKVRRTAIVLGIVALLFYLGFILLGTVRA
jgi:uncharacterized membrane protein (DUF485 family)